MHHRIASIAVILLWTAVVSGQDWRIREPSVDGMTMTEWAGALRNQEREVRWQAAVAFQKFVAATRTSIPVLTDALDGCEPVTRNEIATVLLRRRDVADKLVPFAIRLLHDPDEDVRATAARLLWTDCPRAIGPLLEALDQSNERERSYIAVALNCCRSLPDDDVPKVIARWKAQARRSDVEPSSDGVLASLARLLAMSKARALPTAQRMMRDPNPRIRRAALALCRHLCAADAQRELERRALDDADVLVRCEALEAVGPSETRDLFALAALREAVHDADGRIRTAAIHGLRTYRFSSADALPDLLALARHPDRDVRFSVLLALGQFPKCLQRLALAPLVPLFADSNRWVRQEMCELAIASGSTDRAIRQALLDAIDDPVAHNVQYVCWALVKDSKHVDRRALRAKLLQVAGTHPDSDTAAVAVNCLANLDPTDERILPILADRIRSRGEVDLVRCLDQFGDRGLAVLEALLDEAEPGTAVTMLGELWLNRPSLTRAVPDCLRSRHGCVRQKSLEVLSLIASTGRPVGDGSVAEAIVPAAADPEPETRRLVQVTLQAVTPTPTALRLILNGLRDDDCAVRAAAIVALGQHHVFPEEVAQALLAASKEEGNIGSLALQVLAGSGVDDDAVRRLLVERLGAAGPLDCRDPASLVAVAERDGRGIDVVIERLDRETPVPINREVLAEWMGTIKRVAGTRRSTLPSLTHWACDWEPQIRQAALEAIGRLGPDGEDAIPLLKARLTDESADVADAAREALASVRGGSATSRAHARPCRYSCIW